MNFDELIGDRFGFWAATAVTYKGRVQLAASGKASFIRTDSAHQESGRHLVGARARFILSDKLAASVEGAHTWSRYKDSSDLNETWIHFAAVLEVKVPVLGGWLGLAYGGDTSRRADPDAKFSLNYSLYMDRLIK